MWSISVVALLCALLSLQSYAVERPTTDQHSIEPAAYDSVAEGFRKGSRSSKIFARSKGKRPPAPLPDNREFRKASNYFGHSDAPFLARSEGDHRALQSEVVTSNRLLRRENERLKGSSTVRGEQDPTDLDQMLAAMHAHHVQNTWNITCQCLTPNAGTSGNAYRCTYSNGDLESLGNCSLYAACYSHVPWNKSKIQEGCMVQNYPTLPTEGGCYVWTPFGCPYLPSMNAMTWKEDPIANFNKTKCEITRKAYFDKMCDNGGTTNMYFRGSPAPTPAPTEATPVPTMCPGCTPSPTAPCSEWCSYSQLPIKEKCIRYSCSGCSLCAEHNANITGPFVHAGEDSVSMSMTIEGLDYGGLQNNATLRESFMASIKKSVAFAAGIPGLSPHLIQLNVSRGSVVVDVIIMLPFDQKLETSFSSLDANKNNVLFNVTADIKALPHIGTITDSPIYATITQPKLRVDSPGLPNCPCIAIDPGPRATGNGTMVTINGTDVLYPKLLTKGGCNAWDDGNYPVKCEGTWKPTFCSKKWCFVDPCFCEVPRKTSTYLGEVTTYGGNKVHFSYATCGETDTYSDYYSDLSTVCALMLNETACLQVPTCKWEFSDFYPNGICQERNVTCSAGGPLTGKQACENRGWDKEKCLGVGCCGWLLGTCFSQVDGLCENITTISGQEVCEKPRNNNEELCESYGCCHWQDNGCWSAVGNHTCTMRSFSGHIACEQKNYTQAQCADVGCCLWDDGQCWSGVGDQPCKLGSLTGTATCENRGYDQKKCEDIGCCMWDGFACWSAVGTQSCKARLLNGIQVCENRGFDKQQCDKRGCCKWDNDMCWSAIGNAVCIQPTAGQLDVGADPGSMGCPCVAVESFGLANPNGTTVTILGGNYSYPPNLLTGGCKAWDDGHYPGSCDNSSAEKASWCTKKWCYVDPCTCNTTRKISSYLGGLTYKNNPIHFSYATCGEEDSYSNNQTCGTKMNKNDCGLLAPKCKWSTWDQFPLGVCQDESITCTSVPTPMPSPAPPGVPGCSCVPVNARGQMSGTSVVVNISGQSVNYPMGMINGICGAWDNGIYPGSCDGDDPASWCRKPWCYVDPCNCNTTRKLSSYLDPTVLINGNQPHYSYAACSENDSYSGDNVCGARGTNISCFELDHCKWSVWSAFPKGVCQSKDVTCGPATPTRSPTWTPTRTPNAWLTGEEVCEGKGLSEENCTAQGCCTWAQLGANTSRCLSSVGQLPCLETPPLLRGDQACEDATFAREDCEVIGCCAWDGKYCFSAIGTEICQPKHGNWTLIPSNKNGSNVVCPNGTGMPPWSNGNICVKIPDQQVISMSMVVKNIDYGLLLDNDTVREGFELAVKRGIIQLIGYEANLTTDMVSLLLAEGSVAVLSTITPPVWQVATEVAEGLKRPTNVAQVVQAQVKNVPGMAAVSTGIIFVAEIGTPTVAHADQPSAQVMKTYKIIGANRSSCGKGMEDIANKEDCSKAATSMGLFFAGDGNWADWPSMCFKTATGPVGKADTRVYYNNNSGAENDQGRPICALTKIVTAPHPLSAKKCWVQYRNRYIVEDENTTDCFPNQTAAETACMYALDCFGISQEGVNCPDQWSVRHSGSPTLSFKPASRSSATLSRTCLATGKSPQSGMPPRGQEGCPCVNIDMGTRRKETGTVVTIEGENVLYASDLGNGECKAWDWGRYPGSCDGDEIAEWCQLKWCYVDPCNCNTTNKISSYIPNTKFFKNPLTYSYATCGEDDSYSDASKCGAQTKATDCFNLTDCKWEAWNVFPEGTCLNREITCGKNSSATVLTEKVLAGSTKLKVLDTSFFSLGDMISIGPELKQLVSLSLNSLLQSARVEAYMIIDTPLAFDHFPGEVVMTPPFSADLSITTITTTSNNLIYGSDGCRCVNIDTAPIAGNFTVASIEGKQVMYPKGLVDGRCGAWDTGLYPGFCDGSQQPAPDWCYKAWCYIDPCECNLENVKGTYFDSGVTYGGNPLFFSFLTCGGASDPIVAQVTCSLKDNPGMCSGITYCAWNGTACKDTRATCDGKLGGGKGQTDTGKSDKSTATQNASTTLTSTMPIPANSQAVTTVASEVRAGATAIKVADTSGLFVGEKITISYGNKSETKTVRNIIAGSFVGSSLVESSRAEGVVIVDEKFEDNFPPGSWVTVSAPVSQGSPGCPCIDVPLVGNSNNRISNSGAIAKIKGQDVFYPVNVLTGGGCQPWDDGVYPGDCDGHQHASWCRKNWCYVDPCNCDVTRKISTYFGTAIKFKGNQLHYSYATCGEVDSYSDESTCGVKKDRVSCGNLTYCKWEETVEMPQGFCNHQNVTCQTVQQLTSLDKTMEKKTPGTKKKEPDCTSTQADWSDEKKKWCCDQKQIGCAKEDDGVEAITGFKGEAPESMMAKRSRKLR